MKKILVLAVLITACTPNSKDVSEDWAFPPEMQGCKMIRLQSTHGNTMRVVFCPTLCGQSVTQKVGAKNSQEFSVVFGNPTVSHIP